MMMRMMKTYIESYAPYTREWDKNLKGCGVYSYIIIAARQASIYM